MEKHIVPTVSLPSSYCFASSSIIYGYENVVALDNIFYIKDAYHKRPIRSENLIYRRDSERFNRINKIN